MGKTFPHFWRIKTFLKWILLIHLGLLSTLIHAVEIQPRDSLHSGVVKEGDFTIFPQNRLGNGLYRNGTLMASEEDQQIIGSQPILGIESIVYLFRDVNGQEGLGLVNGINEGTGRLKKVGEEFYEFSNYEIGYQRIFRILQGKVFPVLEKLRTASGVTLSNTHAVFYHITESSNSSDNLTNSNDGWNYKFRLHLTRLGQPQLVSLYQISIVDQSPKPKLSWKNEFELIHRKKDGSEEIYNLQKITPQMF